MRGVQRRWLTVDGIFGRSGVGFWVFLLILALLGMAFAEREEEEEEEKERRNC
jgi:hypothetical protein